ncbi:MAG: ribosomal-processing cysteine protease Prp [Treponema sp.]|nr:ribosomal-processing cysteine protease Prp [Treponema sp.]
MEAVLDDDGVLRACKASGHAGAGKKGTDIVCAAVSVLMRTALGVLSGREGVVVRGGAPEPGSLWMEADYTAEGSNALHSREFLSATGVFLLEGLKSVAQEYPENCRVIIRTLRRI